MRERNNGHSLSFSRSLVPKVSEALWERSIAAKLRFGAGPLGRSQVQLLDGVTGNEISSLTAFPGTPALGVFTAAGGPPVPRNVT